MQQIGHAEVRKRPDLEVALVRLELAFRLIGGLALAAFGVYLGGLSLLRALRIEEIYVQAALGLIGLIVGLLLTPHFTIRPLTWVGERARRIPVQELIAATVGLLVALVLSALVAIPLSMLPEIFGRVLPLMACLALSYLGVTIAATRREELFGLLRRGSAELPPSEPSGEALLDTSAIIDGRIADLSHTGFLPSQLVVPRFVLAEVQYIADSPETLRRNRGRRGLEVLSRLRKESQVAVRVVEVDADGSGNGNGNGDVDAKLVKMARQLHCPIITNDFNLNRVAAIQGVKVLNINELANAVKSVVLPGEEMSVRIIQEGREPGQGVGFLDDGTMVVVESGRRLIGEEIEVVVTRVLQTAAGRMIFGHPKTAGSAS